MRGAISRARAGRPVMDQLEQCESEVRNLCYDYHDYDKSAQEQNPENDRRGQQHDRRDNQPCFDHGPIGMAPIGRQLSERLRPAHLRDQERAGVG